MPQRTVIGLTILALMAMPCMNTSANEAAKVTWCGKQMECICYSWSMSSYSEVRCPGTSTVAARGGWVIGDYWDGNNPPLINEGGSWTGNGGLKPTPTIITPLSGLVRTRFDEAEAKASEKMSSDNECLALFALVFVA